MADKIQSLIILALAKLVAIISAKAKGYVKASAKLEILMDKRENLAEASIKEDRQKRKLIKQAFKALEEASAELNRRKAEYEATVKSVAIECKNLDKLVVEEKKKTDELAKQFQAWLDTME